MCTLLYDDVITVITTDLLLDQWEMRHYVGCSITMSLPQQTYSSPVGSETIILCTLQYYDVITTITTSLLLVQWEGRHYVRYSITMSLPLSPQTCSSSSGKGDTMYVAVLRCHYHYNHLTPRPVGRGTLCTLQYYDVITTTTTDLLLVQWEIDIMYVTVLRCHYHYHHRSAPGPVGNETICTLQYNGVITTITTLLLIQWERGQYELYSITMPLPL